MLRHPTGLVRLAKDRGQELNQRRLRGLGVDVAFCIGDRVFPAHTFIVSIHSPYLKRLSQPPDVTTIISPDQPLPITGIEAEAFDLLLTYMYTGSLCLAMENVFSILEAAHFLQIDDGLKEDCVSFLRGLVSHCDLATLFKIWETAARFEVVTLTDALMNSLEFRLSEFLASSEEADFFSDLGYEEVKQVLSRDKICIDSEKVLLEAVARWCKSNVDSEDEDDVNLATELLLKLKLRLFPLSYLRNLLNDVLGEGNVRNLEKLLTKDPDQTSHRNCDSCVYLFQYCRAENDIMGIKEFVEERKGSLSFACMDLNTSECFTMPNMVQGSSYFQHYGPHSISHYQMATVGSKLLTVGGLKSQKGRLISDEIKSYEMHGEATWEHLGGVLPAGLVDFGLVALPDEQILLIGGLSDAFRPGASSATFQRRNVTVSQDVHITKLKDLTSLDGGWRTLEPMPTARVKFSAAIVGHDTVCVVGDDFCDIYNIGSNQWTRAKDVPAGIGPRPALAAVGSQLYVFGGRPGEGEGDSNSFYRYDVVSERWSPLPPIKVNLDESTKSLRQDVVAVFAHNNLIYVIGWQAAFDNMIHVFDCLTEEWRMLASHMRGTVSPGVLIRKQKTSRTFFHSRSPIKSDRHSS